MASLYSHALVILLMLFITTGAYAQAGDQMFDPASRIESPQISSQPSQPEPGRGYVRVVHGVFEVPEIDASIDHSTPLASDLGYLQASRMHPLASGSHLVGVSIPPLGTFEENYSGDSGIAYTIVGIGAPSTRVRQIVLPRHLSMQRPSGYSLVRCLNGIADVKDLDIRIRTSDSGLVEFGNLGWGSAFGWVAMAEGIMVDVALAEGGTFYRGSATLRPNSFVTLLFSGRAASEDFTVTILYEDDTTAQIPLTPLRREFYSSVPEPPAPLPADLHVAPNPAADRMVVSYHIDTRDRIRITLIDAMGRPAMSIDAGEQDAGPQTVTVPAEGMPAGIYTMLVSNAAGSCIARGRGVIVR